LATLVPNKARLKPSFPSFARSPIKYKGIQNEKSN